jgi:DNA-binding response OmpR family regulator
VTETRARFEELGQPHLDYAFIDDQLPDGFGVELIALMQTLAPCPAIALITAHPLHRRALEAFRCRQVLLPKPKSPAAWMQLLSILDDQHARRLDHDTETIFGNFALNRTGLLTPDGYVPMSPAEVRMFAFLVTRAGRTVTSTEIARTVLARRDRAASALVRRHVSNLRRKLGALRWLLEGVAQRGYRVAPEAWGTRARDEDTLTRDAR